MGKNQLLKKNYSLVELWITGRLLYFFVYTKTRKFIYSNYFRITFITGKKGVLRERKNRVQSPQSKGKHTGRVKVTVWQMYVHWIGRKRKRL